MTVVAPIDRLAAILRLDMPAAVNRSTSRILRMGNLAPGIRPLSLWKKGVRPLGFADHPTVLVHTPPRDPQACSGSPGTAARDQSEWGARDQSEWGARDQSETLLGITRCAHKTAASSLAMEAITAPVRDTSDMESVIAKQAANGSLLALPDSFMDVHRV